MKVLVVDDDVAIRRMAHFALSRANLTVILAAGGMEGLEKAREQSPDAVLLDVMMPDFDGPAVLEALRSDPETASIPVVFLTARSSSEEVDRLRRLGAAGVLTKPFRPSSLADDMQALLSPTTDPIADAAELARLRDEFIAGAAGRLGTLEAALDQLLERPADHSALTELAVQFHQLSGAGSTYGFPLVSSAARQGEEEAELFLREEIPAGAVEVGRWRNLAARISDALVPSESSASGAGKGEEHPIVLVIDRDGELFFPLSAEGDGIVFRRATTAEEGVASSTDRAPAVIIARLEQAGGLGAILHKKDPSAAKPAVILVGRSGSLTGRLRAVRSGADAYFDSAADLGAIRRTLRFLLRLDARPLPRILVLDPEGSAAAELNFLLAGVADVRHSSDPASLENDLVAAQPDLLLLNGELTGILSSDLVKALRLTDAWTHLPLVVFSPAGNDVKSQFVEADQFVERPWDPAYIRASILTRLERSRRLQDLAGRDGLTWTLARPRFIESVAGFVATRQRYPDREMALLLIDLDRTAAMNLQYGTHAGDQMVTSLAALLRGRLRQFERVGRFDEDGLGLVLDVPAREAAALAARILREYRTIGQNLPDGPVFQASFSGAVAAADDSLVSATGWLQRGREGLAYAKGEGGGRVVICHGENEFETVESAD